MMSRILLDTQAWVWMVSAPSRLSAAARGALVDPAAELFLSVISPWELVIKHAARKFPMRESPEELIPAMIARARATELPIQRRHALRVATLPLHHRDPFDRMLIAQAQVEGLVIITADRRFRAYDVEVLAA